MYIHRKPCWIFIFLVVFIIFTPCCSHSLAPKEVIAIPNIDLKSVHRRLEYAGFKPGPFRQDDLTHLSAAIKRFQKIAKLETTGILDVYTWQKLQKLYDPEESEKTEKKPNKTTVGTPTPKPTRALGRTVRWPASMVKIVQKMLLNLHYNPGTLDGRLTSTTRNAIQQFQKTHGFKADGRLNPKTLSYLIDANCHNGCELGVIELTRSDVMHLAALPLDQIGNYTGTSFERMYHQAIQKILNKLGYHSGPADGVIGKQTLKAIGRFQNDHHFKETGGLDQKTTLSILSKYCQKGCRFSIAIRKPQPQQPGVLLKPVKKQQTDLNAYPVNLNDTVFAVEKIECSDLSGDYIIFYQGTVTDKKDDRVFVRLAKRYCYYYRPDKQGISDTDWWCIPVRRHCYSTIKFNAWKGKLKADQIASFPSDRVFNTKITIINGLSTFLQQACKREFTD